MKVGSLVETVADFSELERTWHLHYPKKGSILTISNIEEHPDKQCRDAGIVPLNFLEFPNLWGLSDKTIYGQHNFIELLPPIELSDVLLEEQVI